MGLHGVARMQLFDINKMADGEGEWRVARGQERLGGIGSERDENAFLHHQQH